MANELDIRKRSMEKAWRSQIRLRYSIMADEEIGHGVEEFREVINKALALGQTVRFMPAEVTIEGRSVEAIVSGDADNS